MLFASSRLARWVPCSRLLHLMKRILNWLHLWPGVRNLSPQVRPRATARGICCPVLHGPSNLLILVIPTPSCLLCALVSCILILVRPPVLCLSLLLRPRGEPAATLPSMRESSAVRDTPTSSGKPLARPSSMLTCTHRAKSLHSHPVRTSQNARLRPVVHLKASVGNPVACPKPRPVPSARGAYASYPSLTTSWGKQAEGAVSKSSPPVKAQDGMDTSFPLPPAARISGAATGSQKRSIAFTPATGSGSSNKVIKHSDVHSQHWTRALHLWCELCELTSACSSLLQDILRSDNRHALLEQLLRRVSDNTALRYIAVLWQLFTTVKDLELEISSLSQVQLVDAIHTLQRSRSHHASLHSLNALKAVRWFASTVQPDGFPSLYQGLFHSKAWQSNSMRKEAIPLPLAFVLWLETELVFEHFPRSEAVFAGSVLLCIWCSLRFSDAQHVRLEQFFIDFDSIRSISYRTKSRKFMPFGCISGGLYRLPSNHSWLFHWLSAMEHALDLNSSSAAAPDYIFFGLDGDSVRPLSYAEALVRLRRLLDMWVALHHCRHCSTPYTV